MTLHEAPTAQDGTSPEEEQGLPVDPRAIALGLWERRRWMAAVAAVSIVAGAIAALLFSERVYTAETVMLYTAPPVEDPLTSSAPSLFTLLNMVELQSNLELVRERLKLPVDVRTLGAAVEAELQQKTTLVVLRARWDDPKAAADVANALREVFLENQGRIRREDAEARVRDLEGRRKPVEGELAGAESALEKFTTENKVVDLTQEAQWTLEELTAINLLYEQALIEKKSIDLQVANVDGIVSELEAKARAEQAEASQELDALSEANLRLQRLRESISDDREERSGAALLEEAKLALERGEANLKAGVISQAAYDQLRTDYAYLEAKHADTPQIEQWKDEIADLDKKVIPKGGGAGTPSGNLLKEIMFRSFEIKLQQTSSAEKVQSLQAARDRVQAKLDRMPELQRRHAELTRSVQTAESEKKTLDERLANARRELDASALPFTLVAEAHPPLRSTSSNRRKIAIAIVVAVNGASLCLLAALVVLDPRVRTEKELEIRLRGVPTLRGFPEVADATGIFPGADGEPLLVESFRTLARRLRTLVPEKGARIMIVSPGHDEGSTFVAANLAAVLGRWDERVLVMDAQVRRRPPASDPPAPTRAGRMVEKLRLLAAEGVRDRPSPTAHDLRSLVRADSGDAKGLGDYLSFKAEALGEVAAPTDLAGVWCIPRVGASISPDMLATNWMTGLLEEASKAFDVVLVDAPPALCYVDAENLATKVDAVLLVARARACHGSAVRKVVERLEQHGVPVVGAVLNRIPPLFASERIADAAASQADRELP